MALKLGVGSREVMEAFYEECGYHGALSPSDINFVAMERKRVVGAVRLCHEHDQLVLRGMQVAPDHQRQKVGTNLLHFVVEGMRRRRCWGIAHAHLESFYGQVGFKFLRGNDEVVAPDHLLARLAKYRAHNAEKGNGIQSLIMHRAP